ncbi:hypothetical protein RIF29_29339 [Crotalaria pallida]|uniref:Uncharacterized protein n=1 Tax=Crotalaria pallida TaxID=3830 RepID=A0AAN9I0B1_CROPI
MLSRRSKKKKMKLKKKKQNKVRRQRDLIAWKEFWIDLGGEGEGQSFHEARAKSIDRIAQRSEALQDDPDMSNNQTTPVALAISCSSNTGSISFISHDERRAEAEDLWKIGKDLGVSGKGNDDEILERMIDMEDALLKLDSLDRLLENRDLTCQEIEERRAASSDVWRLSKQKESLLIQKSRIRWLKEGDVNTSFFHAIINRNRRRLAILGVEFNGEWIDEPQAVKEHIKDFFQQRFGESQWERPVLDGIEFKQLEDQEREALTKYFDEEEIKRAVWECDGDKSCNIPNFNPNNN